MTLERAKAAVRLLDVVVARVLENPPAGLERSYIQGWADRKRDELI